MLADLFLAVLIIGAVMMGVGFVEALRTSGRGRSFVIIAVGFLVALVGALLRSS